MSGSVFSVGLPRQAVGTEFQPFRLLSEMIFIWTGLDHQKTRECVEDLQQQARPRQAGRSSRRLLQVLRQLFVQLWRHFRPHRRNLDPQRGAQHCLRSARLRPPRLVQELPHRRPFQANQRGLVSFQHFPASEIPCRHWYFLLKDH